MDAQTAVPASSPALGLLSIISKHKHQNTPQATADMLELGRGLIALKAAVPHGEFLNKLQELNLDDANSRKMMAAARKFGSGTPHHALAVLSKTKLFELLPVDDDALEDLANGGTLYGMTLAEIQAVTIKQLRERQKQAKGEALAAFDDKTKAALDRLAAKVAVERKLDQGRPLQPGDRIRSLHAKRLGKVVSTYGDGSACILWDDGEPQAEGLGHERMPRELLELVEAAPAKAAKVYRLGDYAALMESKPTANADQSKFIDDDEFDPSRQERRKAYCRELCRVLLRYADEEEAEIFIHSVEESIARITASRYAPGLNAAAYDMYARHMLKGGVQ